MQNCITKKLKIINASLFLCLFMSFQAKGGEYSANTHYHIAEIHQKQGKVDTAIEHFEKAIELDPNHFEAHFHLASTYFLSGDEEKAIKYYKKALAIHPDSIPTRLNLALALQATGRVKEALDEVRIILRYNPEYERAQLVYEKLLQKEKAMYRRS